MQQFSEILSFGIETVRVFGTNLVSELDSESKYRLKEESGLVPEPEFIQSERDSTTIVHTTLMMNASYVVNKSFSSARRMGT